MSIAPFVALGCSGGPELTESESESLAGTLMKSIGREPDGRTRIDYYLKSKSGSFRLLGSDAVLQSREPNTRVRVQGSWSSNQRELLVEALLPAAEPGTISQPLSSSAPKGKVAIFMVKDPSLPEPFTAQAVHDAFLGSAATSTKTFLQEVSYGAYGISGDIFGWYDVPMTSCDSYDYWQVGNEARAQAAAQDGFVTNDYRHAIHIFEPNGPDCFHARGSFGSPDGIGEIWSYNLSSNAMAHEIGHNLGFNHANSVICRNSALEFVPISTRCTFHEYNDPYDAMGFEGAYFHFNSYRKAYEGWLPAARQRRVTTAGNYTITAQETAVANATQSLIVPNGNPGELIHVEMRRLFGFDSDPRFDRAVLVRRVHEPATATPSTLYDMAPDGDLGNASLAIGQTFQDINSGVTVRLASKTATTAVVNVAFNGPRCNDNIKNGTETDIDCGGVCNPCAIGKSCQRQRDCTSLGCSTANQCVVATGGLTGSYYEGMEFETLHHTRRDKAVDFEWGEGSPLSPIPNDQFSVRWEGKVIPPQTATYTFRTDSDDGVRLWVDNQLIIDRWFDGVGPTDGTIPLTANQQYDIKLEYFENGGGAYARLMWSTPTRPMDLVSPLFLIPAIQCTAANAIDLGPRNVATSVPGNACVKVSQYPSWWQFTNGLVTLQSGGFGVLPVPASYKDACTNAPGTFVFSTLWQSQPIGNHTANCPAVIQLDGTADPLQITWW